MDEKSAFLLFAGFFTIICAIGDWNWFMENRKAKLWVNLFGRNGARIFYIVIGSIFTVLGGLLATGIV